MSRYPEMHVDLVTEGRLVDIVAEGFDLGVRTEDLVPSEVIASRSAARSAPPSWPSPSILRAPRPSVPTDLLGHDCIRVRLPNGALYRWHFQRHGETVQVDVHGRITLDEATLARAAALESAGTGFFIELNVMEDVETGRLIRVLNDRTPPLPGDCLYYPGRRNPLAGLKAFRALAREIAAPPMTLR